MSSQEDANDSEFNATTSKGRNSGRKRRARACDMCRRRKVRCDGDTQPNGFCTHCKINEYTCTYAPKKRVIDPEYVQSLESQLAQSQEALRKLSARLEALDSQPQGVKSESETSSFSSYRTPHSRNTSGGRLPPLPPLDDMGDVDPSGDELEEVHPMQYSLKYLLKRFGHEQFVGKSSSIRLLQQALNMREAATATPMPTSSQPPEIKVKGFHYRLEDNPWLAPPLTCDFTIDDFPEPDLFSSLIDHYFNYVNIVMPILNRIIFMKSLEENLHFRDQRFGATVLLVCACGARYTSDPRVLLEDYGDNWLATGWKWFRRVQGFRKTFDLTMPNVYDLQIAVLSAVYLYSSPSPHSASGIISAGLRQAMDLGAHKRTVYKTRPNAQDELLKRAFWALVTIDRTLGTILGRPYCIQDEDYDLEFPIECDDEYWFNDDPAKAFKQPAGVPSQVTAFNYLIRLQQIQSSAIRTIYATNKAKALWGIDDTMQQEIVALLDSAMNKWIDGLPEHLRWDPNRENEAFFHQTAMLHSAYYHLQISVHRSFIPKPSQPSSTSLPSLTICTNAARACIHVLEAQNRRRPNAVDGNMVALFNSGIMLVLNIWAHKFSPTPMNCSRDIEDIRRIVDMLKSVEPRMYIAGRVLECMREIAAIGDIPLDSDPPRRGMKRTREGDSDSLYDIPTASSSRTGWAPSHATAGTHGAYRPHQHQPQQAPYRGPVQPVPLRPADTVYQGQDWTALPAPAPVSGWQYQPAQPAAGVPGIVYAAGEAAYPSPSYHAGHYQTASTSQAGAEFFPGPSVPAPGVPGGVGLSGHEGQVPWTQAHPGVDSSQVPLPEMIDTDILTLLSSAPTSLEWNDWGTYISTLSDADNVRDLSNGVSHL